MHNDREALGLVIKESSDRFTGIDGTLLGRGGEAPRPSESLASEAEASHINRVLHLNEFVMLCMIV